MSSIVTRWVLSPDEAPELGPRDPQPDARHLVSVLGEPPLRERGPAVPSLDAEPSRCMTAGQTPGSSGSPARNAACSRGSCLVASSGSPNCFAAAGGTAAGCGVAGACGPVYLRTYRPKSRSEPANRRSPWAVVNCSTPQKLLPPWSMKLALTSVEPVGPEAEHPHATRVVRGVRDVRRRIGRELVDRQISVAYREALGLRDSSIAYGSNDRGACFRPPSYVGCIDARSPSRRTRTSMNFTGSPTRRQPEPAWCSPASPGVHLIRRRRRGRPWIWKPSLRGDEQGTGCRLS